MNEGLDAFIQLYNESEIDEPLIQLDDDTAELMKQARDMYGQEKLNEKLNTIIKQILSISVSEEGEKNEIKSDIYFMAQVAVIYPNRGYYFMSDSFVRPNHFIYLSLSSSLRYSKVFGGLSLRFLQSVMETMCRTLRWDRQPEYC